MGECDEAKPACEKCAKSNRRCEGYERYPVFIQQSGAGLLPRKRFEEVKPFELAPREVPSSPTWERSIVHWFLTFHASAAASWLRYAVEVPEPTAAMHKTLLALSITRFGRMTNMHDAVLQGQHAYSQSLVLVQKALHSDDLMWHDEILATIRAMSLHELFESTSGDPSSWHHHLAGITHLIKLRGPFRHRSRLAQAVLEDVRYPLMLQALILRKPSLFSRNEWQLDWEKPEQKFYDLGFELAAFLEQVELGRHDSARCKALYRSFQMLDLAVLTPITIANVLACKVLLSDVAVSFMIDLGAASVPIADGLMDMLDSMIDTNEGRNCIYPLTCLSFHYRAHPEKLAEIERMLQHLARGPKVEFAKIHRPEDAFPSFSRV